MTSERDYPTEKELEHIEKFAGDPYEWFSFVEAIWWMPDWGIRWTPKRLYMSTGGWSGNEDIIGSMRKNFILWSQCWYSHRTGGHYIFNLPKRRPTHGRDT